MVYEYGLTIGYSKIHIKSDVKEAIFEAIKDIRRHIRDLLNYIEENPYFRYSLKPLDVCSNAPIIAQRMAEASSIAGVGPMASVAGAIADLGLETLLKMGSKIAIVEDGGEISAYSSGEDIVASILTSEPYLSGKIGFLITRHDSPLGIGTSSGKSSQAVSFGEADSVTIIADNAAIADAAATAVCNAVTGHDIKKSISKGLERAKSIKRIRGAIIVREGYAGLIGSIPKMIKIK
ncbi:MAG: UPF0280 family protein [Candidatus Bathyarchaeota archaeon]|nr:UPF0280 family protein [Candidatus Bathyarchaeota archaeon]